MAIHRNQVSEMIVSVKERFRQDVLRGLDASPRFLHSKYFYDAEGDRLFQQIMNSPEYYLTNCELEIFSGQTANIANTFLERLEKFDIVELGAGDATKSSYLLEWLSKKNHDFTYFPVDISDNVIAYLEKALPEKISGLHVHGLHGEYTESIKKATNISGKKKVVLFLGANIGNFSPKEAGSFLLALYHSLSPGDLLLIGFDLKKDPNQILAAYNDKAGVTRQFNLNLLRRINRELDGNFDLEAFTHFPSYNPVSGACRSYLVSLKDQWVTVAGSNFHFDKYEAVYMELSQKYSLSEIDNLAKQTGFKPVSYFYDSRQWFLDTVWEKV